MCVCVCFPQVYLTCSFDSVTRFTHGVSLAEVLIPVESGLTFTDRVHDSVARPNDPLMIRTRVAQQTVRDVVPELREQTLAAQDTFRAAGARAVRAQAGPRRTAIALKRLSGDRIDAPVSGDTPRRHCRQSRQHQHSEEQLEKGNNC